MEKKTKNSMQEIIEMYVVPGDKFLPGGKCHGKDVRRIRKYTLHGCLSGADEDLKRIKVTRNKILIEFDYIWQKEKHVSEWVRA